MSSKGYLEASKCFKSLRYGKGESFNSLMQEFEDCKAEKYTMVSYMEDEIEKPSFIQLLGMKFVYQIKSAVKYF